MHSQKGAISRDMRSQEGSNIRPRLNPELVFSRLLFHAREKLVLWDSFAQIHIASGQIEKARFPYVFIFGHASLPRDWGEWGAGKALMSLRTFFGIRLCFCGRQYFNFFMTQFSSLVMDSHLVSLFLGG